MTMLNSKIIELEQKIFENRILHTYIKLILTHKPYLLLYKAFLSASRSVIWTLLFMPLIMHSRRLSNLRNPLICCTDRAGGVVPGCRVVRLSGPRSFVHVVQLMIFGVHCHMQHDWFFHVQAAQAD